MTLHRLSLNERSQILLLFLITLGTGLMGVISLDFVPVTAGLSPAGAPGIQPSPAALFLGYGTLIFVLGLPFILVLLYLLFGREEQCTVPEYLSMVPDPTIRPWIVNLLFTGDPLDFDENGYYATLLDLHRRGIIRLSLTSPGQVQIRILGNQPLDGYETRVIEFLKDLSQGDLLELASLGEEYAAASEGIAWLKEQERLKRTFRLLRSVPDLVPVSQYFENGLKWILPLGVVGVLLHAAVFLSAGGAAGASPGTVLTEAVFISGLLSLSLFNMWRVQDYSATWGKDPSMQLMVQLVWAGFLAFLFLFPYHADPTVFFWILFALVFLLFLAGAVLVAVAGWIGGPVTRFSAAAIPLVLAVFLGAYILSGFERGSPGVASYVPAAIFSLVLVIQVMVAMSFPSTLLGRWQGNWYEERCKWDAFRAFLEDFAHIRESIPSDLSLWGDWLAYGTALGVGDRVIQAMDGLEVQIPEAEIAPSLRKGFAPLTWTSPTPRGVFGWGWSGRR